MRRLVVGDIHGQYGKLINVLEQAAFNPSQDILFSVGDLADRGPESLEVYRYLMSLGSSFKSVRGNHEDYFIEYSESGSYPKYWYQNGGIETIKSISRISISEICEIGRFLKSFPSFLDLGDYIIMHSGPSEDGLIYLEMGVEEIAVPKIISRTFRIDRSYVMAAFKYERGKRQELVDPIELDTTLIVGHTPVQKLLMNEGLDMKEKVEPFFSSSYSIWDIDTGAGFSGPLTLLDLDTNRYWQA